MSRRSKNYVVYGVLAAAASVGLFLLLENSTDWRWYINWLIAGSAVTFVIYGLDKAFSKTGAPRVPEIILHLLALAGGFVGALLGMLVFRHKSNFKAHPLFLPIIIAGGALWTYAIYWLSTQA
jgi:uncharacterized membrane protein YsdA (DUF1294 family)